MATTKKEGYVDVFVPKGYANEEPNVFVSVKGKNWVLPRGKTSNVPNCVRHEYERSLRAQANFDETSEELQKRATQPI